MRKTKPPYRLNSSEYDAQNRSKLSTLETHLGYSFKNIEYLQHALIHRSFSAKHNERLEFLGDGLLNFVIAEYLFLQLPDLEEGELSNIRSHFVREEMLAQIARMLNLGEYLCFGLGELKTGGATRPSLLSNGLEAIFAALYQDAGFEDTKAIILNLFKPYLKAAHNLKLANIKQEFKDAKSKLQEKLQAMKQPLPRYEVLKIHGKDHELQFEIACIVNAHQTVAIGNTRKRAEREAATLMLEKLS